MTKETNVNHVITALLENRRGVLARVVDLISGRGFNIKSLNVAPTHDNTLSRMTMTIKGDNKVLEQVTKQLNRMVDVVEVSDLANNYHVGAELVLVEVKAAGAEQDDIKKLAEKHNVEVISEHATSVTVMLAGNEEKIDGFINELSSGQILDIARTGVIISPRDEAVKV